MRYKTVHGEPIHVLGQRMTPVARVLSFGRTRGTVGTKQISGWAGGFAWVTPVAMIVDTEEGERRLTIGDATRRAEWAMCGLGVLLTLVLVTVRCFTRRVHRSPS